MRTPLKREVSSKCELEVHEMHEVGEGTARDSPTLSPIQYKLQDQASYSATLVTSGVKNCTP